jgi:hypothetical protein
MKILCCENLTINCDSETLSEVVESFTNVLISNQMKKEDIKLEKSSRFYEECITQINNYT